jgi:magnesium-transporting ATPase (P-type)
MFNHLMVERMLVALLVMGGAGFGLFAGMLARGASEREARNALLLLIVLLENFHIGNCRSETKSAFTRSPLRSPILLFGAWGAFLIHLAAMHIPLMQNILGTGPISPAMWLVVVGLAFTVVPALEIHKALWALRHHRPTTPA